MTRLLSMIRDGVDKRPEPSSDREALQRMTDLLRSVPRYVSGRVVVPGWTLNYVDAASLLSCFEVVAVKRWNDFRATTESPVILDCGANIGLTVLHYKRLFPRARIIAFEPDRSFADVLEKNLSENHINDVHVVRAAVWKEAGQHTFLAEGADGSRLVTSSSVLTSAETYQVATVCLREHLRAERPDFIKLDIEGAEADVLVDCADSLDSVQSMVVECHLMNSHPESLATTVSILGNAGFHVSVNSYDYWIDLVHRPPSRRPGSLGFDQYFLVCAWRPSSRQ